MTENEKDILREVFDQEINMAHRSMQYNESIENKEMVKHWDKYHTKMKDLKQVACTRLKMTLTKEGDPTLEQRMEEYATYLHSIMDNKLLFHTHIKHPNHPELNFGKIKNTLHYGYTNSNGEYVRKTK